MFNSTKDVAEIFCKRAGVYAVPGVLSVIAYSGYRSSRADPGSFEETLFSPMTPVQVGEAVFRALHHSRFISLEEIPTFFAASNDLEFSNWIRRFTEAAGGRVSHNVPPKTAQCHVEIRQGEVILRPLRKLRGMAWEGLGADTRISLQDMTDHQLGEAVLSALADCLPSVTIRI